MRKLLNPHQKSQVALAALKGDKTLNELGTEFQVHPSQIEEWKAVLLKGVPSLFSSSEKRADLHDFLNMVYYR